jgi:predicted 2-oxoglutarate/Fe(II)-dependent dioxygenase YbiX
MSQVPAERAQITFPFVWWDEMFSIEDVHKICAFVDEVGELGPGRLHMGVVDKEVRRCEVVHHLWSARTAWIFDKFNNAIVNINARWYGFDLNGYKAFQYAEYHAEESGYYDWHLDINLGSPIAADQTQPRKLSLAMLLNEPGVDFEGGEFHICVGHPDKPQVCPIQKGRIIAFPSWMMHRVTPVTKGVRKSLTVWVEGPKFK